MARKRWIYPKDGEPYEVGADYVNKRIINHDGLLYNDRLYQDDGDPRYNSRKEHREYMKRNDLAMASDFTNTWSQAAKERESAMKGIDPARREQVARAVHQHLNRR